MKNTVQSEPVAAFASGRTPQPFPLGRWSFFKNPFAKAVKPKPPLESRQSELLLDLVKPVRNDLADSDLEVVATSKPPAERATQGTALPSGGQAESPGVAWGCGKTQLFGAGKI